jgi:hypothetical protein
MVELTTRKREIRANGGNHDVIRRLDRISCASQFNITLMPGTSLDREGNTPNQRSFKPNCTIRTPGFSHLHVFFTSFTAASTNTVIPIYNWTTMVEHKVMSSLYLSMPGSSVDTEYSILWIPHTPATAYAELSIHQVPHILSTAYTEYSIYCVQSTRNTVYT